MMDFMVRAFMKSWIIEKVPNFHIAQTLTATVFGSIRTPDARK